MHKLYVFCVANMCDLVCNVDCDIEVIQQEVKVETALPPKKKKQTQGKVLRHIALMQSCTLFWRHLVTFYRISVGTLQGLSN